MANHSRSHSLDFLHVLGFGNICRACKSFVSKCYTSQHSSLSRRTEHKTKHKAIEHDIKSQDDIHLSTIHDARLDHDSPRGSFKHKSFDDHHHHHHHHKSRSRSPSPLSRKAGHGPSSLSRSTSKKSSVLKTMSRRNSMDGPSSSLQRSLSMSASRKGATPIMYSNSNGLVKPPPMELQLECTLEELCFGCIKKMTVTKDTVTEDGQIIEEDEVLTIKVKPGWKKGTTISFEGMGNETPGTDAADVIFVVSEKKNLLFRREGDDLQIGVEIPLVDALTGCNNLSVPLLGGSEMSLTIDDVIYPGYEKIITGQGMPKQSEPGTRGNLIITFLVDFPEELTDEQRKEAFIILQDAS